MDVDKLLDTNGLTYKAIAAERLRAHVKHDVNGDSMERKAWNDIAWLSVLVEEVGEVAKAMCDHRHHGVYDDGLREEIEAELIQVAAMACAWIDACNHH